MSEGNPDGTTKRVGKKSHCSRLALQSPASPSGAASSCVLLMTVTRKVYLYQNGRREIEISFHVLPTSEGKEMLKHLSVPT